MFYTILHYIFTDLEYLLFVQDSQGNSFIHDAAVWKSATGMRSLLSQIPASITAKILTFHTTKGQTVLHAACRNNDEDVMLELLDQMQRLCKPQGM